jgi:predicted GTPase
VPDLPLVLVDALRPRQVATHHPGETVARMADVIVLNKVDAASQADVQAAVDEVRAVNPTAPIARIASPVRLDDPGAVAGRRVLVVEDGPTITHGGMPYGAGFVAASAAGAAEIVDPRGVVVQEIAAVYEHHPHIGRVLPAMGYGAAQLEALRATIARSDADVVVSGTPADLAALIAIDKPVVRARYEVEEAGWPRLGDVVDDAIARLVPTGP